ncbi:MAG: hypothetical protein O2875_01675 [Planctomycetota bacterium]|nr:hypothetical protein [Planctomycetota bacterium]MDA1261394.1 hypothetical protein [Planctomycetota bacterium]
MFNVKLLCVAGLALSSFILAPASADFINPIVPPWRGSPDSDFYGWESFTSPFGGPNLTNYAGTEANAALFNFGPGAFITSTGNLYGASNPLSISIYAGLTAQVNEVILNVSTIGTIINTNSVRLDISDNNGNTISINPGFMELRSDTAAPGGQGQIQTRAFRWMLQGLPFPATRFELGFNSQTNNISLDAASVDIRYVPMPGVFAILAVSGIVGIRPRRRAR